MLKNKSVAISGVRAVLSVVFASGLLACEAENTSNANQMISGQNSTVLPVSPARPGRVAPTPEPVAPLFPTGILQATKIFSLVGRQPLDKFG